MGSRDGQACEREILSFHIDFGEKRIPCLRTSAFKESMGMCLSRSACDPVKGLNDVNDRREWKGRGIASSQAFFLKKP